MELRNGFSLRSSRCCCDPFDCAQGLGRNDNVFCDPGQSMRLGQTIDEFFGGEGQHEARESAEEHADADEGSDGPDGAVGPGTPDHKSEDEGDDAVDHEPGGAFARANFEGVHEFDDACDEEIDGQQKSEREKAEQRVPEEVAAGEDVGEADEDLPEDAALGVGLKGEDDVNDAEEEHRVAEEEGYAESGDVRDEDGEEAGQNKQDAEGDGPVNGLSGEGWERCGCATHEVSPPKDVDVGGPGMRENRNRRIAQIVG